MRGRALLVLAAAGLLAGCGGSAAKPNGEAAKPAAQILADAETAAATAGSVHLSGRIVSKGTPIVLDMTLDSTHGGKGQVSEGGLRFQLIRIGDTVYIRGSDAFYKKVAGSTAATLFHGKWLSGSVTGGSLAALAPFTDLPRLLAQALGTHGTLHNDGETTYHGQKAIALRDTTDGSVLYVAAAGPPYPLAIVAKSKTDRGTVTFDGWNEKVALTAPKGAIDIDKLTGG